MLNLDLLHLLLSFLKTELNFLNPRHLVFLFQFVFFAEFLEDLLQLLILFLVVFFNILYDFFDSPPRLLHSIINAALKITL